MLPSGLRDTVGTLFFAISELTPSGYSACMCPFPTLQVRPLGRPHMGRSQDGSLLLSCMTLSFTTSRRFIPTLSTHECVRHNSRHPRDVFVDQNSHPSAAGSRDRCHLLFHKVSGPTQPFGAQLLRVSADGRA